MCGCVGVHVFACVRARGHAALEMPSPAVAWDLGSPVRVRCSSLMLM